MTDVVFEPVVPARWGKDHWSLLGYVAACFDGELDRRKLRCNENRHPLLMQGFGGRTTAWQDSWSTRLKDSNDKLIGHDDWDCLDDLEAAGLVIVLSMVNAMVHLTEKGSAVAFKLRQHKERGGNFAEFEMPAEVV